MSRRDLAVYSLASQDVLRRSTPCNLIVSAKHGPNTPCRGSRQASGRPIRALGDSPGGKVAKGLHDLAGLPGFYRNRDTDALFQGREWTGSGPWVGLERAEKDKGMAQNDRGNPATGSKPAGKRSDARRPRSIRFSDSEWRLIEKAATRHGVPVGELVRAGALAIAEDRLGEALPATLSPGHLALIETTWRMAYVLATLARERMLDAGREKELDDLVAAARTVMKETMEEGPA